jgi:hypothetical protein
VYRPIGRCRRRWEGDIRTGLGEIRREALYVMLALNSRIIILKSADLATVTLKKCLLISWNAMFFSLQEVYWHCGGV